MFKPGDIVYLLKTVDGHKKKYQAFDKATVIKCAGTNNNYGLQVIFEYDGYVTNWHASSFKRHYRRQLPDWF